MVLIPTVKWAQRTGCVFLTIDVQDAKDPQIELTNTEDGHGHLTFKATASGGAEEQPYELDLLLFKAVDKDKSKISTSPRSIFCVLEKAEAESWPRLTKEPSKALAHIKVDWDKWVDSDDEGEDNFNPDALGDFSSFGGGMGGMGMGGMGMGGMGDMMGGMGGMPGMGGMGGMPGMGGMGGGGLTPDMMKMLSSMGGGEGGEGMDFAAAGAGGAAGGDDDSDDEDLPELEA